MAERRRPRRPRAGASARAARQPSRRREPAEPRDDGPLLELDVGAIAHGGVTVARHEGRVVFVGDAIPGERVVARVQDASHDRFWRADTVEVLEASADRVRHVWAEASIDRDPSRRAGGAEFGHIRLERQRELKAQVLREALARMGGVELDVPVEAVPGGDGGVAWRTRVRLQVDETGRVGPFAARSHRVVPVERLPLAVTELQSIAPLDGVFPGASHLDLVAPGEGDAELVVHDGRERPRRGSSPRPLVRERVGERVFTVDRDGFWQVHRSAAATLSEAVREAVDADVFDPRAANLDLYGGVGLLAAAVLDRFGESVRLTTVESDPRATDHAAANLAEWLGAKAETARVDRYLTALLADAGAAERSRLRAATVVLDPPRSGAGREVVDRLAELRPRQLVYVACDPVALARDVGLLREHGYELEALRAFDLFPSTHHVEAVVRLADGHR